MVNEAMRGRHEFRLRALLALAPYILLSLSLFFSGSSATPVSVESATYSFRSYFLPDSESPSEGQRRIDSTIAQIAFDQDVFIPSECNRSGNFIGIKLYILSDYIKCFHALGDGYFLPFFPGFLGRKNILLRIASNC